MRLVVASNSYGFGWPIWRAAALAGDAGSLPAGCSARVLSQAGFGFHDNFDASQAAANLVELVQKFRQAVTEGEGEEGNEGKEGGDLGRDLDMVEDGCDRG